MTERTRVRMPDAKDEFNERVNRLLREGRDLPEEVIRGMIRDLEAARREVLARLASLPVRADGTPGYTRWQLERAEQEMARDASVVMVGAISRVAMAFFFFFF